ncbi:phenylalanine--tRNA ligase subunit beta [Candidatus Nitrosotenuis sp. DW1]|uniref:phenylalanine--tRNA ligase subunit beta n=1 Tax=Candidatus Nitrosotenuis sp. DW1 TaxID=2259672 RepID=UPI0015CE04E8|nr:phenylalanine--tRNA ligase subunit beta [Candidatus Nitrosotenuis sp. DW1]QLH10031.1 phenylalanine--tRNA ligase subunit beta [Candidatus Nitrosotenuis sp. DW1]
MPVVTLYLDRLQRLVGGKTNKGKILQVLPFLGLDIEEEQKDFVRVEYSPNRPDYATDVGIASGLQGLLGVKKGQVKMSIKKEKKKFLIKSDSSVKKIRPYISGVIARNGKLDDESIRQLIALQEDLHFGIGRRRKKASIGIHDLDSISSPLRYTAVSKDHEFVPLASTQSITVKEILEKTSTGQEYSHILGDSPRVPIILDAKNHTISFPPIINSALTTVSSGTKNILVEVTGIDKNAVDDSLSVVATTLQNMGFAISDVVIDAKNSSDVFKARTILIDPVLVNQILGLDLSIPKICDSLKKCRLDAVPRGKKILCSIPRFRFDILGEMDLVEEIALGHGIENLKPSLPPSISVGEKNNVTKKLDQITSVMIGLGFTEALNSSLTSKQILYDYTKRDSSEIIEVAESKSLEHTVLRDSILPGLLENLSKNIHESYPQKLFETGVVFTRGHPIDETIAISCVSAHKDANFTEIKSVLQSLLKTDSNIVCKTNSFAHPSFASGRTAEILVGGKPVGIVGEIDSQVIDNFKIRVPVSGFEIKLSGLIFD